MIKAAIVGAQGYSGTVLAELLLLHPYVALSAVFSRNDDWQLAHDVSLPGAEDVQSIATENFAESLSAIDVVFLATPPEVSMQLAEIAIAQQKIVIDLSGAFRLSIEAFEQWYGLNHQAIALNALAQYGLVPWANVHLQNEGTLVSNPGCFATAASMAILPLLQAYLITPKLMIDAKSGVTGAGRSAKTNLLYAELAHNFYPYKVGKHQHTPEIMAAAEQYAAQAIQPILMTHLLPVPRGISLNLYAEFSGDHDIDAVQAAYQLAYKDYSLVHVHHLTSLASSQQQHIMSLRSVVGTPNTHIVFEAVAGTLWVNVTLDNLMKGAASQAVENMNQLFGWALITGLQKQGAVA